MSFVFNFNIPDTNKDGSDESITHDAMTDIRAQTTTADPTEEHTERDAEEVVIEWPDVIKHSSDSKCVQPCDALDLKVVDSDAVEKSLTSDPTGSDVVCAIAAQSDLLPHVYEGGLKIWECSVDLAQYLATLGIAFRGTRVLELGCGAGLPGLVALTQGAHVTFQDYNKEVLSRITAPNISLNDHSEAQSDHGCRCRLIAGDWARVLRLLASENKFDYILTSETIYSRESYDELHDIMAGLIKPDGRIYLAAKTYYFGVGGGTREFESLIEEKGLFNRETCKEYTKGVQREIWKMSLK